MPDRSKHRLYLVLQYRGAGRPGYHVGLLLAPKHESADSDAKDAHRYHATNSFALGAVIGKNGKPLWRYEHAWINTVNVENIVARLLVAKLPASTRLSVYAEDIAQELEGVPLLQEDNSWKCTNWAWQAMDTLRSRGGAWGTIPQVSAGSEIEKFIIGVGDEGTKKRYGSELALITKPSQIHTVDMRQK